MQSEEHSEEMFSRFVSTMSCDNRPDYFLITGGEPMLRPELVESLANLVHQFGANVVVGTGAFFATSTRIPMRILRALKKADHITISVDAFHEKEVPRDRVFATARKLLDLGKDISFQIVGLNSTDPYLRQITEAIDSTFGQAVPAYIGIIGPKGRAKDLLGFSEDLRENEGGCLGAAWPVVAYDGTIVACCNQDVVNGLRAPHLILGNAESDSWQQVRRRATESPVLRSIRTFGPIRVAEEHSGSRCAGYCATCSRLSQNHELHSTAELLLSRPEAALIERMSEGAELDANGINISGYEDWSLRGLSGSKTEWSST